MKHFSLVLGALICWLPVIAQSASDAPVGVSEDQSAFTLSNGIVSARVSKRSGDLLSLKYNGLELLDSSGGRAFGYWSHDTARGERTTRVTIDPRDNEGQRGEVSVKAVSIGNPMGNGPGGSVIADIEIRYALGRGDSGVYTYSIFTHPTNYPGTSLGEARFCAKLNDDVFDWMTVDSNRNMKMITTYDWNHGTQMNMKEARLMNSGLYQGQVEHKYDYSANQFDVRAWGWSSTGKHVGLWYVNPSVEYLSGGPTKVELSAHRDATFNTNNLTAPAPPTLLNYWRSSHYGGSVCSVAEGEAWTKVIGPFLIYCNSGPTPDAMWKDALAKASREESAWPYGWVSGVDYPHKSERAVVTGQLVLHDPQAPRKTMPNLLVGLAAPDYTPARINRGFRGFGRFRGATPANNDDDETNGADEDGSSRGTRVGATDGVAASDSESGAGSTNRFSGRGRGRGGRGGFGGFAFGPKIVGWQNDARYYQFWVRGDARGNFSIPNVRPGTYTLHAFADGILGEFAASNVTVRAGQTLQLGKLDWQPERLGKQLWDIGIPNRAGSEFFKGDDYFHWGWYIKYAELFPDDVNYVVGKSDFRRDWFFEQVPHNEDPEDTTGRSPGRGTTWSIQFNLPEAPVGKATLRLAISGVGTRSIAATVNDQSIGEVTGLAYNATVNRDGIGGSWGEHRLTFDASLMKAGDNVLKLTIPAGGLTSGVIYDYIRLALDDAAQASN